MARLVARVRVPQGAPQLLLGFERPQGAASGARTPDFHIACGWSGGDEQQADGAATPRDSASAIMDQVCSKLRSLEMKTVAADDAHLVPLPFGLLASRVPPTTSLTAGGGRPPPGLSLPVSQPPPPQPVVPRPFVVPAGASASPGECGAAGVWDDCGLGTRRQDGHFCGAGADAEVRDGPWAEDRCASVGTIGHPYTCAEACKFHAKPRGCKDGALCAHCHACRWSRYHKKACVAKSRLVVEGLGHTV